MFCFSYFNKKLDWISKGKRYLCGTKFLNYDYRWCASQIWSSGWFCYGWQYNWWHPESVRSFSLPYKGGSLCALYAGNRTRYYQSVRVYNQPDKGGETMRVKVRSVWKYLIALVFKALERGRSELGGKTKRLHRFTSSLHLNLVWTPFKWISLH